MSLLSKKEIAKFYGITERTVNKWMEKGCPHYRDYVGFKIKLYFNEKEVEGWRGNILKKQEGKKSEN